MTYTEPALPRDLLKQLDFGFFDHLLERFKTPLLRVDQVTAATGWKRRTIYDLCEQGLLETHSLPARTVARKRITRRSVALLLARSANYEPRDFGSLLELLLPTLTKGQLQQLAQSTATAARLKP